MTDTARVLEENLVLKAKVAELEDLLGRLAFPLLSICSNYGAISAGADKASAINSRKRTEEMGL